MSTSRPAMTRKTILYKPLLFGISVKCGQTQSPSGKALNTLNTSPTISLTTGIKEKKKKKRYRKIQQKL